MSSTCRGKLMVFRRSESKLTSDDQSHTDQNTTHLHIIGLPRNLRLGTHPSIQGVRFLAHFKFLHLPLLEYTKTSQKSIMQPHYFLYFVPISSLPAIAYLNWSNFLNSLILSRNQVNKYLHQIPVSIPISKYLL